MYSMDSAYNNSTGSLQSSSEEIDHHQLDSASFFPSNFNNPNQPNNLFLNTINPDITNRPGVNLTKNPKKRSRASRRAPTTVLTTDTSNFRAMVQEFTGIPSPPFSTSSSPPFYPSISRFLKTEPSSAAALNTNHQAFASTQGILNGGGVQLRNDEVHGYGNMDINGLMGLVGSGWGLDGSTGYQAQYGSLDGQRN